MPGLVRALHIRKMGAVSLVEGPVLISGRHALFPLPCQLMRLIWQCSED